MQLQEITDNLQAIADRLKPVLESDSTQILTETIESVKSDKDHYDTYQTRSGVKGSPDHWGYQILPKRPLRFRVANDKGRLLRPDIFCLMRWKTPGQLPVARDLVLRMWATDVQLACREDWDSPRIEEIMTSGNVKERVMLRCHFDLANQGQPGPEHHMQIGGKPHEGEYGWYPKEIDLPRLIHYPVDLVLLCQLTAANFFPEEYAKIKRERAWRKAVKSMEQHLLQPYFDRCLSSVNSDAKSSILLDDLWNT